MEFGGAISPLRHSEFARLDASGTVYFDYTGAALYPASLIVSQSSRLLNTVCGNPHSDSAPSRQSTNDIQEARAAVLSFFDADPLEYNVIFTANASSAIKILAEAFPFQSGSRLVLTSDNHNAVNGLRLAAERRLASVEYIPLYEELRSHDPLPYLQCTDGSPSLFAFPAQSNFSGIKHPLSWITDANQAGYFILLDAASYAPTNPLSLRTISPDFVAVSFYKMFGYPTGVGALIVKKHAFKYLSRDYFSGGTVQFVSLHNRLYRAKEGSEGYEDGTPNFLAMPLISDGLAWLNGIGMQEISAHVAKATDHLLTGLQGLGPSIRIYGPHNEDQRGGTIAFNIYDGEMPIPYESVETAARTYGIALRGGCFCNPGAAERAFGMDSGRLTEYLGGPFALTSLRELVAGPVGALRVSSGIATNMEDIHALLAFLSGIAAGFGYQGRSPKALDR